MELRKLVFEVQAKCAPGYQGSAVAEACAKDLGVYGLSGCRPMPICKAPKQLSGYTVTEHSLDQGSFRVAAACAASHVGTPRATVCPEPLTAYSLSGCERKVHCVAPAAEGYEVTETDLVAQNFQVAATCAHGFEGTAQAEACTAEGEAYELRGGWDGLGEVVDGFRMLFACFRMVLRLCSGGKALVSTRESRLQVQYHDLRGAGQHAWLRSDRG